MDFVLGLTMLPWDGAQKGCQRLLLCCLKRYFSMSSYVALASSMNTHAREVVGASSYFRLLVPYR